MPTDIASKNYDDMKEKLATRIGDRRDCHKPEIWNKMKEE